MIEEHTARAQQSVDFTEVHWQILTPDMLDHPHYTGLLINGIEKELSDDNRPVLSHAYDWEVREGVDDVDDLSDVVQAALHRAKTIAEEQEKAGR